MFVNRTHGVVAATLGVLGLAACDDPVQNTDLRTEGPPDVLAVLVLTDATSQLYETATYCRPNDEKRPSLVGLPDFTTQQVCPATLTETADEVTDAYPDGWYIRIMFDELLDPEIETLTEVLDDDGNGTDAFTGSIASTHPVTLRCESVNGGMVEVDYDGYYSPSGNRVTWPLGPSLVIKPNDATLIATSSACEVAINEIVKDKEGNAVDTAQRGPYTFSVAPIRVLATEPSDDADGESPVTGTSIWFDNIYVQFNTAVDQSSLCDEGTGMNECEFKFTPDLGYCHVGTTTARRLDNGARIPCHVGGDACPTAGDTCRPYAPYFYDLVSSGLTEAELFFGPTPPVKTETDYTFEFTQGTKIKDRCGREQTLGAPTAGDGTLIRFTTDKFELDRANIAMGETASPLKKLKVSFTNIPKGGDSAGGSAVPTVTLDPNGWTITPAPFDDDGTTALTNANMQVVADDFSGQIFIQGNYKNDTMYTFTLKAGTVVTDAWGAQYTQDKDLVVSWKTQPSLAITSTVPANNGSVTIDPTDFEILAFGFNQAMDATTLAPSEFSVTDKNGMPVTMDALASSGCDKLSTSCFILIAKQDLPAGDYKLTLKAGATINDIFGNMYQQTADRVVNFTVEAAGPASPPCL